VFVRSVLLGISVPLVTVWVCEELWEEVTDFPVQLKVTTKAFAHRLAKQQVCAFGCLGVWVWIRLRV